MKHLILQKILRMIGIKYFDKKSKGSVVATLANKSAVNIEMNPSEKLSKELHKPIIRKIKKITVYSGFKDNIWGADLTDMQLISKFNKGFRFYCVLLIFLVNMLELLHWKIKKARKYCWCISENCKKI